MYHINAETRHSLTELLKLNINFQIAAYKETGADERNCFRSFFIPMLISIRRRCEYRAAVVFSRSNNNLLSSRDLHIHVRPLFHISAASEHVVEISGTKQGSQGSDNCGSRYSIVKLVSAVPEKLFMTDLSLDASLMSHDPNSCQTSTNQIIHKYTNPKISWLF